MNHKLILPRFPRYLVRKDIKGLRSTALKDRVLLNSAGDWRSGSDTASEVEEVRTSSFQMLGVLVVSVGDA